MLCRLFVIYLVLTGIGACSSNRAVPAPAPAPAEKVTAATRPASLSVGQRAAAVALQQVGAPYRYGGSSPSGFDCSGLVHYSYLHAGRPVARTTTALWKEAASVAPENLRAGDLLFFSIAGKMSHVGLYLGNGRFVHAPSSGRYVAVESLSNDFYRHALIRAGRPH